MQRQRREFSVFSISALDLFASALGAFILLVMILFPYYQNRGPSEKKVDFDTLMGSRRNGEAALATLDLEVRTLKEELAALTGEYRTRSRKVHDLESKVVEASEAPVVIEGEKEAVAEKPKAIADGVEFSILGLSTQAKSFLIVVDMSGSMGRYRDIMVDAVHEILEPLNDSNRFAILGYQDVGGRRLHRFPRSSALAQATTGALQRARAFTSELSRNFGGGTPTYYALQRALQYDVDAIILMSDGEPTDGMPRDIIGDATQVNKRRRIEIHTVAIGNYFDKKDGKQLTLFLHGLAKRNGGTFVGISR